MTLVPRIVYKLNINWAVNRDKILDLKNISSNEILSEFIALSLSTGEFWEFLNSFELAGNTKNIFKEYLLPSS